MKFSNLAESRPNEPIYVRLLGKYVRQNCQNLPVRLRLFAPWEYSLLEVHGGARKSETYIDIKMSGFSRPTVYVPIKTGLSSEIGNMAQRVCFRFRLQ